MLRCMSPVMCRFSDAGNDELFHALMRLVVRKAPRHEIAVGGARAVQRALWGFDGGVGLQKVGPTDLLGSLCCEAWLCAHA